MNILLEYKVASEESLSEDNEASTTSKKQYEEKDINNKSKKVIEQHKDEIKRQKEDILKFQTTFTRMKEEIYTLRADNKELKVTKSESNQHSKNVVDKVVTEMKESETQTEPTLKEEDSKYAASYGKVKFRHINCKYVYRGKGCKRGDSCWFSHSKREEIVCHYWLEGRCRYSENFCRSGQHEKLENKK